MRVLGTVLVTGVLALAACADQDPVGVWEPDAGALAPLLSAAPGEGRVEGSYIVVLREGATPRGVAAAAGVSPTHVYRQVLNGFAATLSDRQLAALRRHPAVEYVEENRVATATNQLNPPWGLDRIDQPFLPLDALYQYTTTASTVSAYVIDTGIDPAHPEFGGRAQVAFDALGGNGIDCNGHGTAVAGIVGARTYGVAKGVRLRGVRVLNCTGSGTIAGIITGVDWVRANHVKPAVANLSFGGGASTSLNTAVNSLANSGVFVAVAAGNSNANACNYSPSSAADAFTTAAVDANDVRVSSSNYGSCVDAYAPGMKIPTTGSGGGMTHLSGTSAAAPHVAGVAALWKGTYGDAATSTVTSWILANAIPGVVIGNPPGTPNLLVNKAGL